MKSWFSEADPGALAALGFVVFLVYLTIYAIRHWAKRRKALQEMMPKLGFDAITEPEAERLVPELLFHPNGFEELAPGMSETQDVLRRVPMAWSGRLAGRQVTVMDVSVARRHVQRSQSQDAGFNLDRTVLRCPAGSDEAPPDLLLEERVLFKGQVKGQRAVDGVETFGEHYFLFSAGPEDELRRWINPRVRELLGQHRLWTVAAHDGVFYLCRGTKREEPEEMNGFLHEGELLLGALLGGQ